MTDDIIALKVLQHYGAPTRLLDWTSSPDVAAFFAAEADAGQPAEIWAFNEPLYEPEGAKQWDKWPGTTRVNEDGKREFVAQLTAFLADEPPDWFICVYYLWPGFPRQLAQRALSTMTARFSSDHAEHITRILPEQHDRHRFVLPAPLKREVLQVLRERHGIWRGSLFPDSAGAAATVSQLFPKTPI